MILVSSAFMLLILPVLLPFRRFLPGTFLCMTLLTRFRRRPGLTGQNRHVGLRHCTWRRAGMPFRLDMVCGVGVCVRAVSLRHSKQADVAGNVASGGWAVS